MEPKGRVDPSKISERVTNLMFSISYVVPNNLSKSKLFCNIS